MEAKVVSQDSPKLLDRLRAEIRLRHYSIRTEQSYVDRIKRDILFCGKPRAIWALLRWRHSFLIL